MITAKTIEETRKAVREARAAGKEIGFVPTMGALHEGHLSLVSIAKKHADFIVMSIFVNRIQFNDPKDFDKYPRDFDKDLSLAEKAGVDMVFLPDETVMYNNPLTFVDTSSLDRYLCGASRPGHFRGVCTVVTKLFNIVQPDTAVFGQKDIQQVRIVEKMAEDLNIPVSIIIAPIRRENDGLAMSSRNIHLSNEQRKQALCLSESLQTAKKLIEKGETSTAAIIREVEAEIKKGSPDSIDYISIVSYETLEPIKTLSTKSVLAAAAFFGSTRLIDNMIITEGDSIQ